jgi:hypothetical protein
VLIQIKNSFIVLRFNIFIELLFNSFEAIPLSIVFLFIITLFAFIYIVDPIKVFFDYEKDSYNFVVVNQTDFPFPYFFSSELNFKLLIYLFSHLFISITNQLT